MQQDGVEGDQQPDCLNMNQTKDHDHPRYHKQLPIFSLLLRLTDPPLEERFQLLLVVHLHVLPSHDREQDHLVREVGQKEGSSLQLLPVVFQLADQLLLHLLLRCLEISLH